MIGLVTSFITITIGRASWRAIQEQKERVRWRRNGHFQMIQAKAEDGQEVHRRMQEGGGRRELERGCPGRATEAATPSRTEREAPKGFEDAKRALRAFSTDEDVF